MAKRVVEHERIENIIYENPNGVTAEYISKALGLKKELVASCLSTLLESGRVITELHGSEEVYTLSQQFSVDSLENLSSDCIIVCDKHFKIIRANSRFLNITGMKKEDVIGEDIVNHCAIIGSSPYLIPKIKEAVEGKEYRGEISLPISGKENSFIVRIIPTLLEDGRRGTTLIMENITEQKETFAKLQRSEKELDIRNKISHVFLTTPDSQMYAKVLDIIQHSFNSKYGIFGYIDQEGNLVAPSLTKGIWNECMLPDKDLVFHRDKWIGVIRTTIMGKEILVSNKHFKVPEGHISITRCMAAPIVYRKCVIGLLMVANKDSDYDEDDKHLLETIANSIAPILHSRLQRELEENQKKRVEEELERYRIHLEHMVKQRTEELRQSEEMYRTLTEKSLVGVLVIQDGKVVYANPKICEIGGYELEEMLGKSPMDFVHPDDRGMVAENISKRVGNKENFSVYDYRGLRQDGEVRWLEVAATSVNYQGRPAYGNVSLVDKKDPQWRDYPYS